MGEPPVFPAVMSAPAEVPPSASSASAFDCSRRLCHRTVAIERLDLEQLHIGFNRAACTQQRHVVLMVRYGIFFGGLQLQDANELF